MASFQKNFFAHFAMYSSVSISSAPPRRRQAAAVGVQRIQLPHQKHVFDGDGHLQTVAAADYVVGEVQPRMSVIQCGGIGHSSTG